MKEVIIREARREDASRLLEIYAYYIENTAITFEYTVPSLKEFQNRIQHIQAKYPYLVIEKAKHTFSNNQHSMDLTLIGGGFSA